MTGTVMMYAASFPQPWQVEPNGTGETVPQLAPPYTPPAQEFFPQTQTITYTDCNDELLREQLAEAQELNRILANTLKKVVGRETCSCK